MKIAQFKKAKSWDKFFKSATGVVFNVLASNGLTVSLLLVPLARDSRILSQIIHEHFLFVCLYCLVIGIEPAMNQKRSDAPSRTSRI